MFINGKFVSGKALSLAIGIGTLISMVVGGLVFLDNRHALASDFKKYQIDTVTTQMEMRLDIVEDRIERAKDVDDEKQAERLELIRERMMKKLDKIYEQQLTQEE